MQFSPNSSLGINFGANLSEVLTVNYSACAFWDSIATSVMAQDNKTASANQTTSPTGTPTAHPTGTNTGASMSQPGWFVYLLLLAGVAVLL
jgi:hypothetical protein